MLTWPRLRIVGVVVQVATCATPTINLLSICGMLILGGCKSTPKPTTIHETTVRDMTRDPMVALTTLNELADTKEERDMLLAAYDGLWHTNVDIEERQAKLQAEIRQKEHEAQAASDRAAEAQRAQERLDRTWMFALLGAGLLLILGAGAIAYFGWSMPAVPSGKAAIFIGMVGLAFILMAPNAREFAPGLKIGVFTVLGAAAVGLLTIITKAVIDQWRSPPSEDSR